MKISAEDLEYIKSQASQDKRKTRTLSLNEDSYEALMEYCKVNQLHLNRVIDALIDTYLEAVSEK